MYTYKAFIVPKPGMPGVWRTIQASNSFEAKLLLEAFGEVIGVPTQING